MPAPHALILSIGDELILGRTVDTNATFLCRLFSDAGWVVRGVRQVGDEQADVTAAMRAALAEADLVVCSGGLGPTEDDRTRHALAEVLGGELREHAPSWTALVRYYRRHGRGEPSPTNRRQILVPSGATTLTNDRGTAPGLLARPAGRVIACLPGVPHEMKAMAERLVPRLVTWFPRLVPPTIAELWFSGLPESTAQAKIADLFTATDPQVGITASELGHLTLRIVGKPAQVRRRTRDLAARIVPWLLPAAGLAPSLVHELTKRRWTISAAESCTGGQVAAMLTAVPGASAVLRESFVTYHAEAKTDLLGVPPAALRQVVSEACVRAMASGLRVRTGADLAIATTGLAGPGGGTRTTPIGTVWVAVASRQGVVATHQRLAGDRTRIQQRAAACALQLAWQHLSGSGG